MSAREIKPLYYVRWHRVVLDESHMIKSEGVSQSKACDELHSRLRWCCTGKAPSCRNPETLKS
eukprot:7637886-Pyramimonas_sp.AAC.1